MIFALLAVSLQQLRTSAKNKSQLVGTSVVYVDDDWAAFSNGQVITDADPAQAGNQSATFGTDAFATVQAGVNAVDVSGTVKVNPHGPFAAPSGSYAESIAITKDLTLDGNGGAGGTIATAVVVDPVAGNGISVSGAADNVTFRDLRVTGAPVDGINAVGVDNLTFTNVHADTNAGSGINLATVANVALSGVTSNGNSSTGVFVNAASSFSDTDGIFTLNNNHGIQLVDIAGQVSLTRTTANDNDSNNGGIGDGVNMVDGADAGTDAVGSLQVTGGNFSNTPATLAPQRYGIRIGNGIGPVVHSIPGTVVFQSDGGTGPLQHISVTGNLNSGVEIEDGGTTASITGNGNYSSNLGTGVTIASLSGTFSVGDGNTFSFNTSHGLSLIDITGGVSLTGSTVNDNGGNGLDAVDGGDGGLDAVGGLTISGSSFDNTAAANVQLTGINVGPNTGSVNFSDNGASSNSVSGNTAGGVVLGTVAGDVSITSSNGAAYSLNTNGSGISVLSLSGALTVSGITASSNSLNGLNIGDGGTTAGIGGTFSSNSGGSGVHLNSAGGAANFSGAVTLTKVTAGSNSINGVHAINVGGTTTITGGNFSSNAGTGISLATVANVALSGVTINSNSNTGVLVNAATSFSDTDGIFTLNNNHGIQLVDIAGQVSLTRTIANDNDSNNGGIGDGVNMVDGADAGTDAVGSLQVTGGNFSNTPAAAPQRYGIRIGNGIGGVVHTVGSTVVLQSDGSAGPLQHVSITGNLNSGVEIEDGGTTASITGNGNYSNNLGTGVTINSVGTLTMSDMTVTGNGSGGQISNVTDINFTGTTGTVVDVITASGAAVQHTRDPSGTNVINQSLALSDFTSLSLFGGNGADTFNITPVPNGPVRTINVHGGLPTSFPGDVLNIDETGVSNPMLNLNGFGNGTWTSTSHQTINITGIERQPTAASVGVSGRVLTSEGRGVPFARVTITDGNGNVVYATTNPFGYYRFLNVIVGQPYVVSATDKRYIFAARTVVVLDELTNLDFIAEGRNP